MSKVVYSHVVCVTDGDGCSRGVAPFPQITSSQKRSAEVHKEGL